MYKVFIDHKPVIFIKEQKISPDSPTVRYKNREQIMRQRRKYKNMTDVDHPLQIICEDPKACFKEFFSEHKKIKAAGGIVQRKKKYLIIKRKGRWDIPKGRIDKGEAKEVACVREIMEECGIEGHQIVMPLIHTYHTMRYKGRMAIKKTFWYILTYDGPKETIPEKKEGITKAKWVNYDELMAIRGNTYGSINQVLDAFEDYIN